MRAPLHWYEIGGMVLIALVDYWFGKTRKTEANSIVEFALLLGIVVLAAIIKRGSNEHRT